MNFSDTTLPQSHPSSDSAIPARLLRPNGNGIEGALSHEALLSIKDLILLLRRSRSWIYGRVSKKSPRYDPTFPTPFRRGNGSRCNAWRAREVIAWLDSLPRAR